MKVLVSGSHGFVGSALVERLEALGHTVVRLVRSPIAGSDNEIYWNPRGRRLEASQLEGLDAVVHLGGVNIGTKRWTDHRRRAISESRLVTTDLLAKTLVELEDKPKTFICASAVGYYGDRGDSPIKEGDAPGQGFLAGVCKAWEQRSAPVADAGIRVVNIRSGIVLDPEGGILKQQIPLFKFNMGGRLGSGAQYISWISLQDEVDAIVHLLTHENVSGPVNLVSPGPVRNSEFTILLSRALKRVALVPVYRWMLVAAFGSQMTDEMLLSSQRVSSEKLRKSGFQFTDSDLEQYFSKALSSTPQEDEAESQQDEKPKKKGRGLLP